MQLIMPGSCHAAVRVVIRAGAVVSVRLALTTPVVELLENLKHRVARCCFT